VANPLLDLVFCAAKIIFSGLYIFGDRKKSLKEVKEFPLLSRVF